MYPKKLRDALDYLGPSYSIKVIDGVESIYREINSHYDIEISGLFNSSKLFNLFVWKRSPLIVVDRYENLNLEDLEKQLDAVILKYRHLD
ncbi:MAG: hypothetical protein ACLTJB_03010 [Holdemania filiformis]|uniref:hypothetical protein n=1 Tax=Holdemania filiformis TaxID=61171 RepID=UPI0026765D11|nr:hypothetical protein [Holdemania filiformis]